MILCSACLLGIRCRYDGQAKPSTKLLRLAGSKTLIPVCPEQLGGLPTPREPVELLKGRAMTKSGKDLSSAYLAGAGETLKLAQILKVKQAILKQRSPSCGSGQVYDGSFSGKIINGLGITAQLLQDNGVKIISEEDLD